jgi:hypothetical protein
VSVEKPQFTTVYWSAAQVVHPVQLASAIDVQGWLVYSPGWHSVQAWHTVSLTAEHWVTW